MSSIPGPRDVPHAEPSGRGERLVALLLIAAGLVVRGAALVHHRVNSDEPQHLHVAWGWTQGLLPYRDVFDNHSPLFSLIMSPLLAAAGERADIVLCMRLAMVPLIVASLAAVWVIARRLFSPRVALWAVAIAAVSPEFLRSSVEYRTDQLWMLCWLAALAVMVSGRFTRTRAWVTGVVLGVGVATSMKTLMLMLSLGAAVAMTAAIAARRGTHVPWATLAGRAALALLGTVLLPAAFALWFWSRGAWNDLVYGIAGHNVMPGLGLWGTAPWRPLLFVVAVPALGLLAGALLRGSADAALGMRRAVVLLATLFAHTTIEGYWPLVIRSDLLPLLPVESVFIAALALALPAFAARRARVAGGWMRALRWTPALLVAIETALAATAEPVWRDHAWPQQAVMRQVMTLTRPGESVMDAKGEAIYRPRPYHIAIETITEERYAHRLLADAIPESLMAARTAVVVRSYPDPLPPRARAFIASHYLPLGDLRVLGQRLESGPDDDANGRAFIVDVPQHYAVITAGGAACGWLDGTPYTGPRELPRGIHLYRPTDGEGEAVVVWASAVERGATFFPARSGT